VLVNSRSIFFAYQKGFNIFGIFCIFWYKGACIASHWGFIGTKTQSTLSCFISNSHRMCFALIRLSDANVNICLSLGVRFRSGLLVMVEMVARHSLIFWSWRASMRWRGVPVISVLHMREGIVADVTPFSE